MISNGAWRFRWGSACEAPSTVPGTESALPKWQLLLSLEIALWNSMVGFKCSRLKDWTEKGFVTEIIQDEVWSTPRTFENSDGWDTAVSYPGWPKPPWASICVQVVDKCLRFCLVCCLFQSADFWKAVIPSCVSVLIFPQHEFILWVFLFWEVIYVSFHKGTYIRITLK